jgi:hypothetical protein
VGGTVPQGWHPDPFGVHEARYFSADGQPTKLVRDRGVECYDEPPSGPDEVAAAMARMSAVPEPPSTYRPRDPYPYDPAPERGPLRPSFTRLAVTLVIAAAAAVVLVLVVQPRLQTKKPASTPGGSDVAFVTQAATRTLQQRTADVALSATTAVGGDAAKVQGTGAFDLGGKAGTMNMIVAYKAYTWTYRTITANGYVYVGVSINGQSLLPAGKAWVAEQAPAAQGSGTDLTNGDPTAALASLENQGITVRALGPKDIGGISCTGYSVTEPGTQNVVTVWINQQHLVAEFSLNATIGFSVGGASASGASASAAPTGASTALSTDITMDFAYSTAPLQVSAPPAASTMSMDAFLQQLGTNPAVKQLGQLGPSGGAS